MNVKGFTSIKLVNTAKNLLLLSLCHPFCSERELFSITLYFKGAMEILMDLDNFDLPLIYAGTICSDETSRIKRIARLDCLKLPRFMDDIEGYRYQLQWLGYVNGILPKPAPRRIKSKQK